MGFIFIGSSNDEEQQLVIVVPKEAYFNFDEE
jgi:hypothetical protein